MTSGGHLEGVTKCHIYLDLALTINRLEEKLRMDVADDNPVWDLIGGYLGDFCANLFLTVSVERIIIGGGICERAVLMDKIRARFLASLSGYV